jgi:hypothetical protein
MRLQQYAILVVRIHDRLVSATALSVVTATEKRPGWSA